MKILFLDDSQLRHDAFHRNRLGHDVTHVYTALEAINALEMKGIFDLVSLDHDLAEEHYLMMSEGLSEDRREAEAECLCGTGMDVVDHLTKMPTSRRPLVVVVHSWNTSRAEEMVRRLHEAGISATWTQFNPRN